MTAPSETIWGLGGCWVFGSEKQLNSCLPQVSLTKKYCEKQIKNDIFGIRMISVNPQRAVVLRVASIFWCLGYICL